MIAMKRGWMLVSVLLALLGGCAECAVAQAPLAVTTVQDTVYTASGAAASGTVLVSWPGFTTASGAVVPAGTMSTTIGTGGVLSVALAPNAGATPIGSYYTATFHLSDGSTSREFWVVPVAVAGAPPVKLAAIQNDVLPTSVAMQTVSKTYVDMAIAAAMAGHPADSATPYVLKVGDTMTGPLTVPTINVGTLNATTMTGALDGAAIASGTVSAARLPVFGMSGSTHAQGVVPDPGASAGASRYLREDGTWDTPPVGGSGTMSTQNANAVAITGGGIDGTSIGAATPAAGSFTNIVSSTGSFKSTYTVTISALNTNYNLCPGGVSICPGLMVVRDATSGGLAVEVLDPNFGNINLANSINSNGSTWGFAQFYATVSFSAGTVPKTLEVSLQSLN